MAYLEIWDLLESQAALDLMAYLAPQVCLARRASLESVFLGSKDFLAFLAFLAPLERRAALGALAFPGSTEPSDPLGFRASEVTLGLPEHRAPQVHLELQDLAPLEPWAPQEDLDSRDHQVLPE